MLTQVGLGLVRGCFRIDFTFDPMLSVCRNAQGRYQKFLGDAKVALRIGRRNATLVAPEKVYAFQFAAGLGRACHSGGELAGDSSTGKGDGKRARPGQRGEEFFRRGSGKFIVGREFHQFEFAHRLFECSLFALVRTV